MTGSRAGYLLASMKVAAEVPRKRTLAEGAARAALRARSRVEGDCGEPARTPMIVVRVGAR